MIHKVIHLLISLPITIWVNFKALPIKQAIRLPMLIDYRTRVKGIKKGSIILPNYISFAIIKYGWGNGSEGNHCNNKNYIYINGNGKFIFTGKAQFALGATIRTAHEGIISFGNNFKANQNFTCFSNTKILLGNNILIGWNVNIRDSDGHNILNINNNEILNPNKSIEIGNHVWIGSHVDILKGASINDNSIIGFKSLVTKKYTEKNVIIAGSPAKIIKTNINWEE